MKDSKPMAPNILDQIVTHKHEDLVQLQQNYPLQTRKRRTISPEQVADSLLQHRIIAEIKRASPSMGQINMQVDILGQARNYQAAGAGMVSVLTDERYFCGSFSLLEGIGAELDCPLLCKDFVIDPWQIDAAYAAGADAILLIVTCFQDEEMLQKLYDYALQKGLVPLVEIYHPAERYLAYQLKPYLLGVNSRDLQSMEIDLEQGSRILELLHRELSMPQSQDVRAACGLPELPLLIGESGVSEIADARLWAQHGADCLLIGTSLMLADPSLSSLQNRMQDFRSVFS